MKSNILSIALVLTASLGFSMETAHAQIHSRNKDLVVIRPSNLPEQTRGIGDALFLHSDNSGNTFLYIEQNEGKRLVILDVSNPAHIKTASVVDLQDHGAFDFIRPLGREAAMIRYRQGGAVAVLDVRKSKAPEIRTVDALINPRQSVSFGDSGYLSVDEPFSYAPATPHDYQVVDTSVLSEPALLLTIKGVEHQLTNSETGTTFLLGSGGLTVIRHISVEEENKAQQMQMQDERPYPSVG